MFSSSILLTLASFLVARQLAVAEDCIHYEEHKDELMTCCKYPQPFPMDSFGGCVNKAQQNSAVKSQHELYQCIFECFYEKIGLTSQQEPQKVNTDKLAEYVKPFSEEFQNVMLKSSEQCEKAATEFNHGETPCNPFAMEVEMCVIQQIEVGCPTEYFNADVEVCRRLKNGEKFCH